jgi:hypothetical protein
MSATVASRFVGAAWLAAVTALAAPAAAGGDDSNALFDAGVLQMEAGRYEQACPSIEHSYELDPRPGVLFTLAECQAKRGRIASAVDRYGEYLALYQALSPAKKNLQTNRPKAARAQITALSPQLPKLVLELEPGAPSGILVECDGRVVPAASLGTAMPVDPGEHVIRTSVSGGPPSETRVTFARSETRHVVVNIRLPAVAATPLASATSEPRSPGRALAGAWITSAGLVGLVVGLVAGAVAVGNNGVVTSHCNVGGVPAACDHQGLVAANRLKSAGLVSTVGFVSGGGLVVAGLLVFGRGPAGPSPAAPKPAGSTTARRVEVGVAPSTAGASVVLQGAW